MRKHILIEKLDDPKVLIMVDTTRLSHRRNLLKSFEYCRAFRETDALFDYFCIIVSTVSVNHDVLLLLLYLSHVRIQYFILFRLKGCQIVREIFISKFLLYNINYNASILK